MKVKEIVWELPCDWGSGCKGREDLLVVVNLLITFLGHLLINIRDLGSGGSTHCQVFSAVALSILHKLLTQSGAPNVNILHCTTVCSSTPNPTHVSDFHSTQHHSSRFKSLHHHQCNSGRLGKQQQPKTEKCKYSYHMTECTHIPRRPCKFSRLLWPGDILSSTALTFALVFHSSTGKVSGDFLWLCQGGRGVAISCG